MNKGYDRLLIKKFRYWSVYLHENQCYLGRLIIWSHHESYTDIFDLHLNNLNELVKISRLLKLVLNDLFAPDLYNWSSYANVVRHPHVHLIPRYNRKVKQLNIVFEDSRWGANPAPYDKNFILPDEKLMKLKHQISSGLEALIFKI